MFDALLVVSAHQDVPANEVILAEDGNSPFLVYQLQLPSYYMLAHRWGCTPCETDSPCFASQLVMTSSGCAGAGFNTGIFDSGSGFLSDRLSVLLTHRMWNI